MNMDSNETLAKWLCEWETISRRIVNIDARLWQGASIVLVISLGGISLIGWHEPKQIADVAFVLLAGLLSAVVLTVWWFMFHRWIHLQRIYSFRAREIEMELELRFNRYVWIIEHWNEATEEKKELSEKHSKSYELLNRFYEQEHKSRHFTHMTIQVSLRWLTIVLWLAWLLFVVFYWIAYVSPLF